MWLKHANQSGRAMALRRGQAWAEGLNYAGHSDWRLPSARIVTGPSATADKPERTASRRNSHRCTFVYQVHVYNPEPFENIQVRTYWTDTPWPGDTTHAMTQDFDDGGQNDFAREYEPLGVGGENGGRPPGTPVLYGVVSEGTNTGALISIDIITGAATVIGNTGLQQPCSLTYNDTAGLLYVNDCFGTPGSTRSTSPPAPPRGWARRRSRGRSPIDSSTTCSTPSPTDIDFATLMRLDVSTGASLGILPGQLTKGPITALTARPTDGRLFGAGFDDSLTERWLFTVGTAMDAAGALEREIATVPRAYMGLAFHPNGTLYATDGRNLFTLNTTTGASTIVRPFGTNIGEVGGLAFVAPPPRRSIRRVDQGLSDRSGQRAVAPVAMSNVDDQPRHRTQRQFVSHPVFGVEPVVTARVRNRGSGGAEQSQRTLLPR